MNARILLLLTAGIAAPLAAQIRPASPVAGETVGLIGLGVSFSGTERDTLGVLVSSITRGGPADQAGINQGNRIAELNGVNLRLDAADVGQPGASDVIFQRLTRAMRTVRSGGEVAARVYAGGRYRNVQIRTAGAPSVTLSASDPDPARADPRAAAPSVSTVLAGLTELRGQLRRLAQSEEQSPLADTIMQLTLDLGALQNRLRDAQARQQGTIVPTKRAIVPDPPVFALKVAAVTPEMASYFGEGSEHGLLVTEADSSFAPIRKGDVIIRVDGSAVKADAIKEALDPAREERVDLLRGGKLISVVVHPRNDGA